MICRALMGPPDWVAGCHVSELLASDWLFAHTLSRISGQYRKLERHLSVPICQIEVNY